MLAKIVSVCGIAKAPDIVARQADETIEISGRIDNEDFTPQGGFFYKSTRRQDARDVEKFDCLVWILAGDQRRLCQRDMATDDWLKRARIDVCQ